MKKIRLLLLAFGLLLAIFSSGQTSLTYRFANPKVTNSLSIDYFEFDIDVIASTGVTYFVAGQAALNFNNSSLSTSAFEWTATLGPNFSSKPAYNVAELNLNGSAPSVTAILGLTTKAAYFNGAPVNSTNYTLLSNINYQTLFHVKVPITSSSGTADIGFIQSAFAAQQSYITAPATTVAYTPVTSTTADFTNTYLARIYSTIQGWTQIGGSVNWGTSVNTSIWDGTLAAIPTSGTSLASAIRIHSGAMLTIPPTGQLTAASIENNTANGLVIQSDATGTGSLIVGSVTGLTGTAVAQRYMTTGAWHQVSPPLVGQPIANFLTANDNVASSGSNRAMINYVTSSNTWSAFYINSTGGTFAAGQGYMMRSGTNTVVNFGGAVATGNKGTNLSGAGDTGWNLIGNPFTSAISLNNAANGTNGFMVVNAGSLDPSNVGVYFWNQASSVYDVVNNATLTPEYATLGQAFFVKSIANNAAISFPTAMQVHQNGVVLKSGNTYPEIKLIAANDGKNASTSIKFIGGTTKGLDPGYDAGIFKLDASVSLYTKLVEDNGVQFMLQCLPNSDISKLIIPVGIDSKAGGKVVFSAETLNLSPDCKVILEDKQNKIFTDLSTNIYETTIAANSSITDRFQIHTSYLTTGTTTDLSFEKLSAYAYRNIEIRLKGTVSAGAVATLYDVQGRNILVKILEGSNLNIIPTPNIRTGIYMLSVNDHGKVTGFKIPVAE